MFVTTKKMNTIVNIIFFNDLVLYFRNTFSLSSVNSFTPWEHRFVLEVLLSWCRIVCSYRCLVFLMCNLECWFSMKCARLYLMEVYYPNLWKVCFLLSSLTGCGFSFFSTVSSFHIEFSSVFLLNLAPNWFSQLPYSIYLKLNLLRHHVCFRSSERHFISTHINNTRSLSILFLFRQM